MPSRLERAQTVLRRATTAPFLVRCAIGVSLLLAMAVAWPIGLLASQLFVVFATIAVYPAVMPRGRGYTFAVLVIVSGWLLNTVGYGERVALWRVLALAALLYLGHSLTALAAVLPYDAVVNLDVIGVWTARALAVILASSVLTVVALSLTADLAGDAFLIATLVGLAGAVGATMLLSRLLRRV